jgi:uncharacterized oxidoreductase
MPTIQADRLYQLARRIVLATGSSEKEAHEVADHLVKANLSGHDSHGLGMLPDYARMVRDKLLVPNQQLETVVDFGAIMLFDAQRGFGQAMAAEAMRRGCARAKETGAAVVGLRYTCHVGRIGHWAEQCAAAGMASIHFVSVADHHAIQAPHACADPRLGTNPFCAALPGEDGTAILLDMATTTIAFGKARVARNKGVQVPPNSIIDPEGRPTTDPVQLVDEHKGALMSFGVHKGSGLAIMCEMLAGCMTGGPLNHPGYPQKGSIINNMLSIIIDPTRFGDAAKMRAEIEATKDWIRASRVAPGFDEILMPGEPELRSRSSRGKDGIPLDPKSLGDIIAAGASLGVPRAELEQLVGA